MKRKIKKIEEESFTETQFFDFTKNGHLIINKIIKAAKILAQKIEGHKRKIKYVKIKKQRGKNPSYEKRKT